MLPVLVPAAILARGNPFAYKLANALAVVACTALVYWLALALAGRKAALLSAWLVALTPEPLMAAVSPSEDILGSVFALLSLALLLRLQRSCVEPSVRWARVIGAGALLGGCLFLADLQRGLGPFLLAAIAAVTLLQAVESGRWRATGRLAVVSIGLPLVVFGVFSAAVRERALGPEARRMVSRATWRWLATFGNSESDGSPDAALGLRSRLSSLSDAELRQFALSRTMSDLVDAPATTRLVNYSRRIAALHHLGDQYGYYLTDTAWGMKWAPTRILSARGGERLGAFMRTYSDVFRVAFLALGLVALLDLVLVSGSRAELYGPVLLTSFMTLGLGLLGAVQARYLFPLWFILPVYVGRFVARLRTEEAPRGAALRSALVDTAWASATAVVVMVAVMLAWRVGGAPRMGKMVKAGDFTSQGRVTQRGRYELNLVPSPDGGAQTTLSLAVAQDRVYSLELFVSADSVSDSRCRTQLGLLVNDVERMRREVASGSPAAHVRLDGVQGLGGRARVSVRADAIENETPCPVLVSFPSFRSRPI